MTRAQLEHMVSNEADVYPRSHPERSDLIDGSIGELSPFHETYGYYAQGIGKDTAVVPEGWEDRLIPVRTSAGTGWCLEVHDLVISKYVAGREKDRAFVRAALKHGLADGRTLLARLASTPLPAEQHERLTHQIEEDCRQLGRT